MSEFLIQTATDTPIYRQLVDQVRRMAASGRLKPGDRLPSVRQLAEELAINPMTVSKAYSLLENAGLLERRRGVGMVMRDDAGNQEELIRPVLQEAVRQGRQLGLERAQLVKMIEEIWKEKSGE